MTRTSPTPTTIATILLTALLLAAGTAYAQEATSEPAQPPHDEEGPQNLTLQGTLYDADTNNPIQNATIEIHNMWHDGDTRGHENLELRTDDDGTFHADVSQGEIRLIATADGYDHLHTGFPLQDNASIEIPMQPAKSESALLQGTILSDQGEPIPNAYIHIRHTQTTPTDDDQQPERTINVDGYDAKLRYDSQHDTRASERTDDDGTFQAHLAEGLYEVRATADDHIRNQDEIALEAGEPSNLTLTLTSIPEPSVTLEGTIIDQATGEPIPNAHIDIVNDRWGQHDRIHADANGQYETTAIPGPLLIQARADQHDAVPCEKAPDDAEEAWGDRCRIERTDAYLPRVTMLSASEDETLTVDLELKKAPTPDATISGWVINETSEEGIEDATVTVRNEVTGEWGQATTDEHGSFSIPVHPGYYTIRAQHADHPVAGINAEVEAGEEARVTIEAPPGPVHDRYDVHPMPEPVAAQDRYVVEYEEEAADDAMTNDQPAPDRSDGDAGAQTYEGSEGGLGPYPGDEQSIPWVGAMGLLATSMIGALILSARARR